MRKKVKNSVSAVDINSIRVSLFIPMIITIFCSVLDMLCQINKNMVDVNTFKEGSFWVLGTLISYFFPAFLSAAVALLWQHYVQGKWSGIKEGKASHLLISTIFLLFFYIVYLLYADTYYIIVFVVLNVLYALFVTKKCIDQRILKNVPTSPGATVVNGPN